MAIFTGIATFLGGLIGFSSTSFFVTATSFILKTAFSLGINYLLSAFAGDQTPGPNINGKLRAGGDISRSFLIGLAMTSGSLVYANTWGTNGKTPNCNLTQVIALSDQPCQSLEEIWINGEKCTIDYDHPNPVGAGYPISEYTIEGSPHAWVKFYDGTQTAADDFLQDYVSTTGRPYGADRIGNGIAYAIFTATIVDELFTGFPEVKFVCVGKPLYDITKDSTAGGSGTQVLSDPSTWGGDADHFPATQIHNLLLGLKMGDQWFYGMQNVSPSRIPYSNISAQVEKCRTEVDIGDDETEPQFRTGGEILVNTPLKDTIEALLTGANGRLAEFGGKYNLFLGEPEAAVWSFSDEDIISTEEQSFTPFFRLADIVNGVTGKYPSPADGWNITDAPPIYRTDLEEKVGNRRLLSNVSFDFVPYAEQVQRLMRASLLEAQRARRHTFTLGPEFFGIIPGDYINFTSSRNGYVTKKFRVDGVIDKYNLDIIVDITEIDPNAYDWDHDVDYRPPVIPPTGPIRPPAQATTDFDASPYIIYDSAALARRPACLFEWDATMEDIKAIKFEIRRAGASAVDWIGRCDSPKDGQAVSTPLLPSTDYEARGCYIPTANNRTVEWSSWVAFTTDNIKLGGDDLYPIDLEWLGDDLVDAFDWLGSGIRDALDELDRVSKIISDGLALGFQEVQFVRRQLTATAEGITASYQEAIVVAVGEFGDEVVALAEKVEALQVVVEDPVTGLTAQATAINLLSARITTNDGLIAANASAIIGITASVGDISAEGLIKFETFASPGGGWSRTGLLSRVSVGDVWTSAALYLDAKTDGSSRFVASATLFTIVDPADIGGTPIAPFVFIGGVAYLDSIKVRNAEIENGAITSAWMQPLDVGVLS